ncbi:MAG TPA: heavy metal-associated domain-containing protein [Gemmatimonadales bacterium]|nr:heavy metal-associated domain-containing protein [Gemmatimonadales bacterium]
MGCRACATRVRGALLHAAGVLAADVDLERGLATVYSRQVVDTPSLAMNLQRIGRLAGQEYRLRHFATIRTIADVEDPAESAPRERNRSDGAAEQ